MKAERKLFWLMVAMTVLLYGGLGLFMLVVNLTQ